MSSHSESELLTICLERLDAFRCFFRQHVDDSTPVKDAALLEFLTSYIILYFSCFYSVTLCNALNLDSHMNVAPTVLWQSIDNKIGIYPDFSFETSHQQSNNNNHRHLHAER